MKKEIGGYIELDKYKLPMLHEKAMALNCGRNALIYVCLAKNIKKLYVPYFICSSVTDALKKYDISFNYYNIDINFKPVIDNIIKTDEHIYFVNYYGQLNNVYIEELKNKYRNIIVDNAQAYFQMPVEDVDTIYTCRKFFGVPDGAFVYTNQKLAQSLAIDESYKRMNFLLGRFERTASEFYEEYAKNNKLFANESIKIISKLTNNLLHGIDYEFVKNRRTKNYNYLFDKLVKINKLSLKRIEGAFAYPLYIDNGNALRKKLIAHKIYVPILWPNVITDELKGTLEYNIALNILPLPCDQRYDEEDMEYVIGEIYKCLN